MAIKNYYGLNSTTASSTHLPQYQLGISTDNTVSILRNGIEFKDRDGNHLGFLRFEKGKISFEGKCDSSAKAFFDALDELGVFNQLDK